MTMQSGLNASQWKIKRMKFTKKNLKIFTISTRKHFFYFKYLDKLKLSTKGDPTPKLSLKFEWIRENSAFTCLCNKALIKYYI